MRWLWLLLALLWLAVVFDLAMALLYREAPFWGSLLACGVLVLNRMIRCLEKGFDER